MLNPLIFILSLLLILRLPNQAQATPAASPDFASESPSLTQQLQLSSQQMEQLQVIASDREKKLNKILDPSQEAQLNQALAAGQPLREILPTLNLSERQLSRLQRLQKSTMNKIDQTLTPAQRQQLQNSTLEIPPSPPVSRRFQ